MDSGDDDEPARSSRQVMTGEDSLSKAVSANITRILEDLLKDYDKTERPSYNEGLSENCKKKIQCLIHFREFFTKVSNSAYFFVDM